VRSRRVQGRSERGQLQFDYRCIASNHNPGFGGPDRKGALLRTRERKHARYKLNLSKIEFETFFWAAARACTT